MDTNDKFKNFLRDNLDAKEYEQLLKLNRSGYCLLCKMTLLMTMSALKEKLFDNTHALIKQFLENLSREKASEYVSKQDVRGNSVIFICEDIVLLNILIHYVRDINARNNSDHNALMNTCFFNIFEPLNLAKINLLLKHKIDINAINYYSETALMYCCVSIRCDMPTNIEALKVLLDSGANVNTMSITKRVAFDYVTDKNLLSDEFVRLLQGEGASVQLRSRM